MSQPMNQPPKRQIGPPHIVAMAKAEAYREVLEILVEKQPDEIKTALGDVLKKLDES